MFRLLITGGSGFIGTNLIDELHDKGVSLFNLDIQPPKKSSHVLFWQECDILDFDKTLRYFKEFQPTHVIHLAARTDTRSKSLDDYKVNYVGTENILKCVKLVSCVERVVVTSTQFVFGPPGLPSNDEEYKPLLAYGISKVLSEKVTRNSGLNCIWTIVRPTNIWGPWHPRYPSEFWLVLKKGLYFQPSGRSPMRTYGYVKNIIDQIMKILEAESALVNQKVYYLGDPTIPLLDWTNGFSLAITGKPVRVIPRVFLWFMAFVGSFFSKLGIRFPITLSRFRSMTEDYITPIDKTIKCFGVGPYSLDEGIKETKNWLSLYWDEPNS